MLSYDCQIRVWYKHTDQMAICHHSNYICYYEAARSELLRYLGMSFEPDQRCEGPGAEDIVFNTHFYGKTRPEKRVGGPFCR